MASLSVHHACARGRRYDGWTAQGRSADSGRGGEAVALAEPPAFVAALAPLPFAAPTPSAATTLP
ncbi:MAG TPA: hypothetical protein VLJ14_18495 [Ktedonobacterales bacterium]|nr:hypothetical protein [Ktedonobacterales bacterium]